jgi:hypothetical protein
MSDDAQSTGPVNLIFLTTDHNNFEYSEDCNVLQVSSYVLGFLD